MSQKQGISTLSLPQRLKKEGYVQISNIFAETAANEKEHAEIWYKILTGIGSTRSMSCMQPSKRLFPVKSRELLRVKY